MKKIYLISYYFAPLGRADGVNRAYMVKYLAEAGWDIEVISCENPHGFIRNFQKDPSLLDIIPSDVKLHRVKSKYWGPIGGIAELTGIIDDCFRNWISNTINAADTIIKEPGFIYAIVPPITNAKIAAQIAIRKKMPLVIDFRDDDFNLNPSIVQKASTIIASTEISLKNMKEYYKVNNLKGTVIYNGYAIDILPELIHAKQSEREQFRIIYTGLLNLDQDPAMLARAVRHMEYKYPQKKNKVVVDYYGPKNFYTHLFLRKYLSENILFHGYVPFQKALAAIAQADIAYTSLKDNKNAYCIPSKIFQYIAMGTPVLGSGPHGALENFILKNQFGRYSLSDDIDAQAEDIYHFLRNQNEKIVIGNNIQQRKTQFSMKSQIEKLSKHLTCLR
ncbi:MAG: hypothetical protein AB7U45_02245 [Desulfamplus sp.]